jgi:hypothetical protein
VIYVSRRAVVVVAFLVVAVSAVVVARIAIESEPRVPTGSPVEEAGIETSYAFDVTNRRYLAAWADAVVIGRVVEQVSEQEPRTTYRVEVVRALKGDLTGAVQVRQLGYVDDQNVAHETADQPLLTPGRTYMLALGTGDDGDAYTLVAGPAAAVPLTSTSDSDQTVAEYRRAVREQVYPPGVPRRGG